ncbi:putative reverse transcriptase domain-containing protein [Tanacetum coccineum]
MSSYTHPSIPSDYDVEDAFSSTNAPNYIPTSPDYFPVTPGTIYPDSSDDLTKDLLSSLSISPFHNDSYMKRISPPKDAETPVESPIPISPSSSVRSSSPMPPKRTSTAAAPAMTQDAIRQLVADSVAAALEAQAANMANTDNTNKNTGTSETSVARKGTNDHKRNFNDRRNTITNNDNNYPNNRNHNNHPNDHNNNNYSNNRNNNNYQDNHNNHNRNNDYHQQQNRRQETIKTYAATPTENKRYTKKYHGNLPLFTRCTLHHTGVCTGKCRTYNKVGHQTRNCRSKGPATGSKRRSVSVTCHACGEKGHYKSQC